jgi:hypothetical protein
VDYFRLFYEYFEEKVSDFLFVNSGGVINCSKGYFVRISMVVFVLKGGKYSPKYLH